MAKFRKKPVVIEAVQLRWDTWSEVCELVGLKGFKSGVRGCYIDSKGRIMFDYCDGQIGLVLPTEEGNMLAVENDWIIRGVEGELYPCKPSIFEKTYEPVEE